MLFYFMWYLSVLWVELVTDINMCNMINHCQVYCLVPLSTFKGKVNILYSLKSALGHEAVNLAMINLVTQKLMWT